MALNHTADQLKQLQPSILGEVIGQQVGLSLERVMAKQFSPMFQEISDSLKILHEIKEDQGQEVLENLIQSLRTEVLEPIVDRLDQSAHTTEQASRAVQTLHQELGDISQKLAVSVLTIQNFQQETLGQLQKFALSLQGTLQQFQTETKQVLQETAQGIRQGTVEILDRAQTTFEQQSKALVVVGNEAVNVMNTTRDNLVDSIQTIQNFQQETLQQFQTETKEVLQETAQTIRKGTIEVLDRAQITFEQQSHTLKAVGDEAASLIDTTRGYLVESLQEMHEMLQSASQQVDNSMKSIKETAEAVSKLALQDHLSWGARLRELQEAARGIGQELQRVEKANQQMQETYQQTLSSWQIHLNQSLGQFSESQTKFFDTADSSMATVCGKFLETANVLVEIEKDRRNGNSNNGTH